MDIAQITQELVDRHYDFMHTLKCLSDRDFQRKPVNKWTAGQQLEHIVKSVRQVDKAFGLPLFVLQEKFGLLERPSVSYQEVVKNYLKVLKENPDYVLPEHFAPEEIPLESRDKKLEELQNLINSLCEHALQIKEEELDTYILPHPVMGKLSLREVLYFKIYHVQHHDKQILQNLNSAQDETKS
jgi:hypothetical protein